MRLLLLVCMLALVQAQERPQVLFLHSYHKAEWTDELMRGYAAGLGGTDDLDLAIEYMDAKRRQDPEYLDHWWEVFTLRHAKRSFAAVITSDDVATRAALARQPTLLGGAPVVFCGVNDWTPDLIAGRQATGVVEHGDFAATLALARRLRPRAAALHVLCDRSETGLTNLAGLRAAAADWRIELVQDVPFAELPARLAALPATDAVFFIAFWKDGSGQVVSPSELASALRASAAPVFGRSEWMIGKGQLGGLCVTGFAQGQAAGRMARRILGGEAANAIPVLVDSPNQWLFDHAELDRHQLDRDQLPPGAIITNLPDDLWSRHHAVILAIACVMSVLAAGSVILLILVARLRRARRQLAEREALQSAIFDQTYQLMGLCDLDGRLVAVNRSALAMIGARDADVIGRHFADTPWWTHDPQQQVRLRDALGRALLGETVHLQAHHRDADGRLRRIDFTVKPVRDARGAIIGLVPEGRDVSELHDAMAALRESEERLRQIAEHIPQAFWMGELPSGRILYASPAAERIYGRSLAELMSSPDAFLACVHPDDRQRVARSFAAATTAPWHAEYRVVHPDGSIRHIDNRSVPVPGPDGIPYRIAGLAADVTETRELHQRMQAAQRLEAMGQLAGGVAHDFNNQLAAILGFAELIAQRTADDGELSRWTENITTAARHSASLTRQLLAFARRGEVQQVAVDLNQTAAEALELARVGLDARIATEAALGASPATVIGDAGLLTHAVLNLLLNARDAMPGGGTLRLASRIDRPDPREPRLAGLADAPHVVLSVTDTGTGMPPSVLDRIFEPFFTTKPIGKGTGLGLAAVLGTLERHGGAVAVASSVGQGTTFSLWLPLADREPGSQSSGKRLGMAGVCVLVADDEPVLRELIAQQLGSQGHRVVVASDATTAIAAFREHRPALVLLDLMMPGGGGAAAFAGIHALDPQARVLLLSGYSEEGEARQLLEAGARAFVAKPFTLKDLLTAVAQALA